MSKGRPKAYQSITYEELGDYVGNRGLVKVSKSWLNTLMGEIHPQKASEAPLEGSESEDDPSSKECTKCNKTLPFSQFNNDKRRKFGKRSQCKKCYKRQNNNSSSEEELPKIEFTLTTFDKPNE